MAKFSSFPTWWNFFFLVFFFVVYQNKVETLQCQNTNLPTGVHKFLYGTNLENLVTIIGITIILVIVSLILITFSLDLYIDTRGKLMLVTFA